MRFVIGKYFLLSGRPVYEGHGPNQPAEAGGHPDGRGQGQGQAAVRAQVSSVSGPLSLTELTRLDKYLATNEGAP